MNHKNIIVYTLSVSFFLMSSMSLAHGYVEHPKARQQYCVDDGGYWWPDDGSAIPNKACRQAFLESGTYQFVQNIEFSANVADYENQQTVESVVHDGILCAAGDSTKRGMDIPSEEWQRTRVKPDSENEIDFIFLAATPHNPSYWEFYLSRSGFEYATRKLSWSDLELIDRKDDVAISDVDGKKVYQMKITIPAGRKGDAILFTRWQRRDAAGEGFYNCSDITIEGDTSSDIWHDKGYFIQQGDEAIAGDQIWFRVFDEVGDEIIFEKILIEENNQTQSAWSAQLAKKINETYSEQVAIGVKDSKDQVIRFDEVNRLSNKVWLSKSEQSFALEIKKHSTNLPPEVSLPALVEVKSGEQVTIFATAIDPENAILNYQWLIEPPLSVVNFVDNQVTILANHPDQTSVYPVSVIVSDGVNQVSESADLKVMVDSGQCQLTDPDASNYPAWNLNMTYQSGSQVSHRQLVWQAKWWNQQSEPDLANDSWSLLSIVELGWQKGVAYQQGNQVDHLQRRWRARWWTIAEPGSNADWDDIGTALCQ
ncbi:lytic polysaccharide monooxygenase [Aliikangiella sp. G2MR2-5]|uniref:lytic polysaccharide monooxygenase n=1 Tax=Aliikangiella sp. G2MR2-5 TaxID=2788943 RepID=UPI0018A8B018|nr:lytic polysaccharide monooxygenase [Aliikangiella sp. G2MR2-5]